MFPGPQGPGIRPGQQTGCPASVLRPMIGHAYGPEQQPERFRVCQRVARAPPLNRRAESGWVLQRTQMLRRLLDSRKEHVRSKRTGAPPTLTP